MPALPTHIEFAQPAYFALLALLPVVVLVSRRSLAGLGRWRQKLVVGLRCLVIAVLAVALADPHWVRTTDDQTVVFALDQSDSVPGRRQLSALEFVKAAAKNIRPGKDRVAGLAFAGRASVWQLAKPALDSERLPEANDRHQTDIASALKIGLGLFPAQTARRLVLLSDGNENRDSSSEIAQTYGGLGIPIDVVPLPCERTAEILVDRLSAPATANRDEAIELQLFVRSKRSTTAQLHLYHNDRLMDLDPDSPANALNVHLNAGANRFSIPLQLDTTGVHRFQAVLQPNDDGTDTISMNNQGRAFTIVGQAERVLIVASSDSGRDEARVLAQALHDGGIESDQISTDDLLGDPATLVDCSTLILCNVSAFTLGEQAEKMIASFVEDQGGGLIAIGGDEAFSVGGYAHTPLEEVLPVETNRDKLKLLSLAMVIIIDRSGSMAGEKIAMARQAATGAIKLLGPRDQIGVIAFDSLPTWIVGMQPATDKGPIARLISSIASAGGTNMYPAIEQAYRVLTSQSTNLKHIILLTDGQSAPGDFAGLAKKCHAVGITISTIAVGPDADQPLLDQIASATQGRMYVAKTAQPLPQIFVHETMLASRSGIFEKPFTPRFHDAPNERIMVGFSQARIPPLRGHVVTATKPGATAPLVRPTEEGDDPILAYWQAGLGRSVAFTSGLWAQWAPEWIAWPEFSKFWTQAVRYAGRAWNPSDLEVESSIKNGEGHVVVSAEHLPRDLQSSLELNGRLILPDFSTRPLSFQRTSVGRLEADFNADMPGTYLVNMAYVNGQGRKRRSGTLRTGGVVSYSKEYASLRQNDALLAGIARQTGGRMLSADDPESVFEPGSIRPVEIRRSVWDILVRVLLALFLLDVAVRRLAVTPAEVLGKMRRWIEGLGGAQVGEKSVATLAALRKSQDQKRESGVPSADAKANAPDARSAKRGRLNEQIVPQAPHRAVQEKKRPPSSPSEPSPAADADDSPTARLLKAKRRLKGESGSRTDDSDE